MSDLEEKKDRGDHGSAWTSYADLFMTVAIIFLVMFVYAMLSAGVNQLRNTVEKQQQLEYQMGKIPEPILKKNQEDMAAVKTSAEEIAQKRKVLAASLQDIMKLSETL